MHTALVWQRARVAAVMLLVLDLMGFMIIGLWPGDRSWPYMPPHHSAAAPLTASAAAGLLQDATAAPLLARLLLVHPDTQVSYRARKVVLQTLVRYLGQDLKLTEWWTCQLRCAAASVV